MIIDSAVLERARKNLEKSRYFHPGKYAIPIVEENTTYISAGPLAIGLEMRVLDAEILKAHLDKYGDVLTERQKSLSDGGPTVHVLDAADRFEYLRFDCFAQNPHYHYLVRGLDSGVVSLGFDRVAHGEMIPWTLSMLRTRIREMLVAAGADHLVPEIRDDVMDQAIIELQGMFASVGL